MVIFTLQSTSALKLKWSANEKVRLYPPHKKWSIKIKIWNKKLFRLEGWGEVKGKWLFYVMWHILWITYASLKCCVFRPANERVLCNPFAGRNHFFDAKKTFSVNFRHKMLHVIVRLSFLFFFFVSLVTEKVDFQQRTACWAPVCWSKYTTP